MCRMFLALRTVKYYLLQIQCVAERGRAMLSCQQVEYSSTLAAHQNSPAPVHSHHSRHQTAGKVPFKKYYYHKIPQNKNAR
jgi:hypothetical protein